MRVLCLVTAVAVVVGCRASTETPRVEPPGNTFELPTETAAAIRVALASANGPTAPRWQIVEAFVHEGLAFERYQLAGGPNLILVLGGAHDAVTHQVWFPWGQREDNKRAGWTAAMLDAARPTATFGDHEAAVSWHASYWRTTTVPELLDDVIDRHAAVLRDGPNADALRTAWKTWDDDKSAWSRTRMTQALERVAAQAGDDSEATRDRFNAEAKQRFTSRSATLVLAGSVRRADVLTAIAAAYPSVDAPPVTVPSSSRAAATKRPLELTTPSSIERAFVWWSLADASVEDQVALEGVAHVLSRRALAALEQKGAKASRVLSRAGRHGAFAVEVELAETLTATVSADTIRGVVDAIGRGETTGLEIESAQSALGIRRVRDLSSLERRAALAGRAFIEHGSLRALDVELTVVDSLSERDLRRAAKRHLGAVRPVVVVARPKKVEAEP